MSHSLKKINTTLFMANYFVAQPKKNNKKEPVTFIVERLDNQGQGVAYLNNKPVFIPSALPNEKVKAVITEQKSKYSKAKLLDILNVSADRVIPKCQHYQQCGGCDLQHVARDKQLDFKETQLQELFSRQSIKQSLPWQQRLLADAWHYRRKARIGVQYNKQGQATVGFRRRGSNQLQPIKKCMILTTDLAEIFQPLLHTINQLSQSKSIGHIEVNSSNYTPLNQPLVTVIIRQLKPLNEQDKNHWLQAATLYNWHIIIDEGQNSYPLTAENTLYYKPNDKVKIKFQPNDFIQVNDKINQQMVRQAIAWLSLSASDTVLDLFCGLGNFSLPIAQYVKQVVGVEGVIEMVERAADNASENNIVNTEFFQADLNAQWLAKSWAQKGFTKVILDPARAGAFIAIEQLVKLKIVTILYISCDATSLAKDSKLLVEAGYSISKIALMDMFTHTKHSETMVLFELN
jgi:23S rRNA (uracil1939-C5)-methyltransferase